MRSPEFHTPNLYSNAPHLFTDVDASAGYVGRHDLSEVTFKVRGRICIRGVVFGVELCNIFHRS